MKYFLLLLSGAIFISGNSIAQSRKMIRELRVKTVFFEQVDYKNGNAETFKKTFSNYDKHGNLLLEIEYDADSILKNKETYVYNRWNAPVEHSEFDSTGKLIKKTITSYDSFHDKLNELVYNETNSLVEKTDFNYNAMGQKTEEVTYTGDKLKRKVTYQYDKKGSLTERTVYKGSGEIISTKKYWYRY